MKRAKKSDKKEKPKRIRQKETKSLFSNLFSSSADTKEVVVKKETDTVETVEAPIVTKVEESVVEETAASHQSVQEVATLSVNQVQATTFEEVKDSVLNSDKEESSEISERVNLPEESVLISRGETFQKPTVTAEKSVVQTDLQEEKIEQSISETTPADMPAPLSEEEKKSEKEAVESATTVKKKPKKQAKAAKKTRKKKKNKWLFFLLFAVGILLMAYPFVSQFYYRIQANRVNNEFDQAVADMDSSELDRRYKLAQAFNAALQPTELQDPFTEEEKKEGLTEYANMLKINEQIGYVNIPKIDQKIPMFVGVSDEVLEKGAGLLEGTSLPVGGSSTHTVISAHRGLPDARLFTDLDKLKKGDVFYIHVLDTVLAYEVDKIEVVEPDNFDPILIKEGKDYATLLTCTPYMLNTHRLLVRGKRIPYSAPVQDKILEATQASRMWQFLFILALIVIALLLYLIYRTRKLLRQQTQGLENK